MTGFHMKRNTGLKWVKSFQANIPILSPLKTLENETFSDVIRWVKRKIILKWDNIGRTSLL